MIKLTAIVSGGQTGADRGGLDAAIQLGLGYGGWAPKGWRAEDGQVPEIYRSHMRESTSPDYGLRTRLNVQDSDATLIVSFAEQLSGGSEGTAKTARSQRKPCKHLVLPAGGRSRIPDAVRTALLAWVEANRISVLNVAGPRESKEPGIHEAVRDAIVWIFEDEIAEPQPTYEALAALARDVAEAGGTPTHVAIPLENVELAIAAGIEVTWQSGSRPPMTHADALAQVAHTGSEDVRGLAAFLLSIETTPRPPSKADIERLRHEFYALPDNGAGGNLHVVLDDNNWERCNVEYCRTEASNGGDIAGARFAELLLTLTDEQLHEYLGPGYCGRCCADYGDAHTGQTFDNVDGRCPDCGSWPATGAAC